MFEGKLVGIYTASGEGVPMVGTNSIQAVKGSGLAGDRYANGTGHYSAAAVRDARSRSSNARRSTRSTPSRVWTSANTKRAATS